MVVLSSYPMSPPKPEANRSNISPRSLLFVFCICVRACVYGCAQDTLWWYFLATRWRRLNEKQTVPTSRRTFSRLFSAVQEGGRGRRRRVDPHYRYRRGEGRRIVLVALPRVLPLVLAPPLLMRLMLGLVVLLVLHVGCTWLAFMYCAYFL